MKWSSTENVEGQMSSQPSTSFANTPAKGKTATNNNSNNNNQQQQPTTTKPVEYNSCKQKEKA